MAKLPHNYAPTNIPQLAAAYGCAGEQALAFEAGFRRNSSSGMPFWASSIDPGDYRYFNNDDPGVAIGRRARRDWEQNNPGKTFDYGG